ncbi:MAG: lysozyme inhibitor LprI family protein [Terracidiphilus sp.]|jgi:TPR repeat protein
MLLGMKKVIFVAFLLIASTARLWGQLENADAQTKAKCEKFLQTPLPAEAPIIVALKKWPECNSYKFYSGIGTKVDYAAARQCAWSERLASQAGIEPRFTVASVFGGAAMLTVLYANGEGIEKNLPLALRFACEAGGAPAEISVRLEHIESLDAKVTAASAKYDFCDDITSGFMEGFCAAYGSELADQKRSGQLNSISARMSPIQLESFARLLKEEKAYAHAHAAGEIDLSGTARAMYQIDAEDTLRDDFLTALQSFEAGRFPTGSAALYSDTDVRLNSVYRKAISDAEEHKNNYGAVQPEGVRNAERAWLKYRDAWIAFAKLRYPTVSPEAWLVLLTKDRTSILDGSFCDMDAVDGPCAQPGDTWKPSPLP